MVNTTGQQTWSPSQGFTQGQQQQPNNQNNGGFVAQQSMQQQQQPLQQQPLQQQQPQQPNVQQNQSVGNAALQNQNPANIQSYMTALNNVGASSNNGFNSSAAPATTTAAPLYSGAAPVNNGGAGTDTTTSTGQAYLPQAQSNPYASSAASLLGSTTQPSAQSTPQYFSNGLPTSLTGNYTQAGAASTQSTPQYFSNGLPTNSMTGNYTQQAGAAPANTQSNPYATSASALVSDQTAKTDIKPAERKLEDFLSKLGAHSYEYKDKADGAGRYVSPMAQELEKSEIGKSMVIERPDGKKMVDYGRGFGFILSSQAYMNNRLNEIEKSFSLSKKKGK